MISKIRAASISAKHWQIMLVLLAFELGKIFIDFHSSWLLILQFGTIAVYFGWLMFAGSTLLMVNNPGKKNRPLFVLAGSVSIVLFLCLLLFQEYGYEISKVTQYLATFTALISFLYVLVVVARNIKMAEVGPDIDINDYFNLVLGLFFFPIGIWFIQPRINTIASRINQHGFVGAVSFEVGSPPSKRIPTSRTTNRIILSGILLFLVGLCVGYFVHDWFQLLIPVGTVVTFSGIIYWIVETDFSNAFIYHPNEGILGYWWNVLAMKWGTLWFAILMIAINIRMIKFGFL